MSLTPQEQAEFDHLSGKEKWQWTILDAMDGYMPTSKLLSKLVSLADFYDEESDDFLCIFAAVASLTAIRDITGFDG